MKMLGKSSALESKSEFRGQPIRSPKYRETNLLDRAISKV